MQRLSEIALRGSNPVVPLAGGGGTCKICLAFLKVYINTNTGLNAFLIPILKFHRENLNEFPEGTVVTQIIDCVGNVGKNAKTEVT